MKRYISIDEVKEGMLTAKPVMDEKDRMLMPQGREITNEWLGKLKQFGVKSVCIDDPDYVDENASLLDHDQIVEMQGNKFSQVKDNPNMLMIMDASLKYLLKKYSQE